MGSFPLLAPLLSPSLENFPFRDYEQEIHRQVQTSVLDIWKDLQPYSYKEQWKLQLHWLVFTLPY